MKIKADYIRMRIKELGLTQEDLGRAIGDGKNPRQTGNNVLRRASCSDQVADEICHLLRCKLEDIKVPLMIETELKAESDRIKKLEQDVINLKVQLTACEAMGRTKDELIEVLRLNRDILTRDLNVCRKELDDCRIENVKLKTINKKK